MAVLKRGRLENGEVQISTEDEKMWACFVITMDQMPLSWSYFVVTVDISWILIFWDQKRSPLLFPSYTICLAEATESQRSELYLKLFPVLFFLNARALFMQQVLPSQRIRRQSDNYGCSGHHWAFHRYAGGHSLHLPPNRDLSSHLVGLVSTACNQSGDEQATLGFCHTNCSITNSADHLKKEDTMKIWQAI